MAKGITNAFDLMEILFGHNLTMDGNLVVVIRPLIFATKCDSFVTALYTR